MPRPKRDEILRHETESEATNDEEVYVNFHDVDEEGFTPVRESGIVSAPVAVKRGKGKRSLEDMMASMPNDPAQCTYALERIAAVEDQIVKILSLCTPTARELVFKQRASLRKYI